MKSLNRLGTQTVSLPLSADDILEFHAARILLLIFVSGIKTRSEGVSRIDGLTKMAKLDFFTRYPDFFEVARAELFPTEQNTSEESRSLQAVEAAMVRHHYGPWDKRYYHVLAYLEAKRLITVSKSANSYSIATTGMGQEQAKLLSETPSFSPLVEHMKEVKKIFGKKSGSVLKNMIYRLFDKEVGQRPLGEEIGL